MKYLLLLFSFVLILTSCKNDDTLPNCGCESQTLYIIPDLESGIPIEKQTKGYLFYKDSTHVDYIYRDESNDRFWIVDDTRHFIICNEEILGKEYDYLKQENVKDSVEVQFFGEAKQLCVVKAKSTAYSYDEIILTEIKKQ